MDCDIQNFFSNKRFIYGAGKYGKLFLSFCREMDIEIQAFVQSQKDDVDFVEGISVISMDDLVSKYVGSEVFIAIKNRMVLKEIERKLNFTRTVAKTYDCSDFICNNLDIEKKFSSVGIKYCLLCQNKVEDFLPVEMEGEVFKTHHVIGSGPRNNCICPLCGQGDRIRWLYYVLSNKTNISKIRGRVLHFAPEEPLSDYIRTNSDIDYYTADIIQERAMHITDITDIQYKDEIFDYVICNHVLEHVLDEGLAVEEIKRVLKPNGKWIFSFPICTDMKTFEDESIIARKDRLNLFGYEEHVRLYGTDYVERFEKYGLCLKTYSPINELSEDMIEKYGFIRDDVVIIAEKNRH